MINLKCSMLALLAGSIFCQGCGGAGSELANSLGSSQPTHSGQTGGLSFRVTEPANITVGDDIVDSVELEAFDANGNRVAGPETLPFANQMDFKALPETARSVKIDYARSDGAFTLARASFPVEEGNREGVVNPSEQPVKPGTSKWKVVSSGGGFHLQLESVNDDGVATNNPNFRIKGVCYSPSPINVLGDGAPNIGDFFFDNVINPVTKGVDFYNWEGLWNKGDAGDGFKKRGDIEKMRAMGVNTIRVYSMLSRQQNDRDAHPELPEFPDPTSVYHHQHKKFLDLCWNNGVNPIYVIVGIPMPPDAMYKSLNAASKEKVAFYDHVIRETVGDLKDHPAVLGFTIINEVNNGPEAFPGVGNNGQMTADRVDTAVQNDRSDFYWGQLKKYTDQAKATAPNKLVGACFHDFREIAQYASAMPKNGPTYLEQMPNLDFVGVNTYELHNYNTQYNNGWGAVQGPGRKALLFSELGFPATTRDGNDPRTIKQTDESLRRTAEKVREMLPQAYINPVSLGACYFEYCDEWWKQRENQRTIKVNGQPRSVQITDEWFGGPANAGFPNGWWDEEGFGLNSVSRYPGLANNAPVVNQYGPERTYDVHQPRQPIIDAVKEVYRNI